ncbi:hypothetical protein EVAR_82156_1 [Eumeta japonica]|uniref:Uncharacterized protein n=1 Tax=Eumeta variegata TaxID=151549 RepID=A0A4C1U1U4_EUMVA|nr:hypothetical protein EVAR_82156_1 [Eumeta japonica]
MGLQKRYAAVGQSARNTLLGLTPRISGDDRRMPLNMLISEGRITRCEYSLWCSDPYAVTANGMMLSNAVTRSLRLRTLLPCAPITYIVASLCEEYILVV